MSIDFKYEHCDYELLITIGYEMPLSVSMNCDGKLNCAYYRSEERKRDWDKESP